MADDPTPNRSEAPLSGPASHPAPAPDDFLESSARAEMLASAPSYAARGGLYLMLLIIVVALLYAYFGKTEVVIKGVGALVPLGDAVLVQAVKGGPLAAMFAGEGDIVKAGQLLARLDTTPSTIEAAKQLTEHQKLERDLDCARVSLSILREALAGSRLRLDEAHILQTCSGEEAETLLGLKKAEMEYEQALVAAHEVNPYSVETMQATVKTKEEAVAFRTERLKDAETDLSRAGEQFETYQGLYRKGLASKIKLLEEQKRYEDAQAAVSGARLGVRSDNVELDRAKLQLNASRAAYELSRRQADEKYQLAVLKYRATINAMELKREQARMALAKLALDAKLQSHTSTFEVVRAPVAGTIATVGPRTAGELVKAGDVLFTINPADRPLVAKVMIENKDMARVAPGLPAKIKLAAFPYQDYGTVKGRIARISPDAKKVDQLSGYETTITLDRDFVAKGSGTHRLFTGLTVTAEIVVEEKRIIEFLLEPFRKLNAS